MTARAHHPADQPLAEVREIHPRLIRRYRNVYAAQAQEAREASRGAGAALLRIMLREFTLRPGRLTIDQRARMRAWQDVLTELIERQEPEAGP